MIVSSIPQTQTVTEHESDHHSTESRSDEQQEENNSFGPCILTATMELGTFACQMSYYYYHHKYSNFYMKDTYGYCLYFVCLNASVGLVVRSVVGCSDGNEEHLRLLQQWILADSHYRAIMSIIASKQYVMQQAMLAINNHHHHHNNNNNNNNNNHKNYEDDDDNNPANPSHMFALHACLFVGMILIIITS
jgi:hypothetical protein